MRFLLIGLFLLTGGPVWAMSSRDTADGTPQGEWNVGVFNALRYGWSETLEVETRPVLVLAGAPNAVVRWQHGEGAWRWASEYGLSLPTGGMMLLQRSPAGSLMLPSFDLGDAEAQGATQRHLGFWVVPRVGAVLSMDPHAKAVFTARTHVALGLPLSESDLPPLDSAWAPFDVVMAPVFRGWRWQSSVVYDLELLDNLRARFGLGLAVLGNNPKGYAQTSRWVFDGHAGLDWGVFDGDRLTVGLKWYNWDQRRQVVDVDSNGRGTRRFVRNNDWFPTIDYIWQ